MQQERREHTRELQQEHVKVDVISKESPKQNLRYDCFSRDFSKSGVRVHGNQSFELGTHVQLVIHMSEQKKDYSLQGVVKWFTETTEHEVVAGIEFDNTHSSDLEDWQKLFV